MIHNLEAERELLGAMLSSQDILWECLSSLQLNHFYDSRHKRVFQGVAGMARKSLPIGPGTVFSEICTDGSDLELNAYLFQISKAFPSPAHVEFYINDLKQKARIRGLLDIAEEIKANADHADCEGFLSTIEEKFLTNCEDRSEENLLSKATRGVLSTLEKIKEGSGIGAIPTGVTAIDTVLQGIVPGMYDVYAAEAGAGKTSLIEMIIRKFLSEDRGVCAFQGDMTPEGFLLRLACKDAGVATSTLRRHGHKMGSDLANVEYALGKLSRSKLKLYNPQGKSAADVKAIVRREARKNKIELVVVDHVRSLSHTKSTSWDGLQEISSYLRQSTNDTGIPHLVLAHINRTGAKSERPTISDIKGGDQLKDDSDNCCVMWSPDRQPGASTWKVNFAFDKTRWDWNSVETMTFNGPRMRFERITEENNEKS